MKSAFEVEKGVKIPAIKRRGRPDKYPWKRLKVGESFFVPKPSRTFISSHTRTGRVLGMKFVSRTMDGGVRVNEGTRTDMEANERRRNGGEKMNIDERCYGYEPAKTQLRNLRAENERLSLDLTAARFNVITQRERAERAEAALATDNAAGVEP